MLGIPVANWIAMNSRHWKDLLLGIFVIGGLAAVNSCERQQRGIPNDSGASYQDKRTDDSKNKESFDGAQGTLAPESRH